jgi:hypothetical protein
MRNLKRFEIRQYLSSWLYNVGFSPYDDGDGERTLMAAMSDSVSLRDWFKTDNVDYDEDVALAYLVEQHRRTNEV